MKNFTKRDESSYKSYENEEEHYPEEVVIEADNNDNDDNNNNNNNNNNNKEHIVCEVANCYQLKIRSAPSENAEVFGIIKSGSELHILEDSDPTFYKVVTEYGLIGFVMKEFVKLKN